MGVQRAAQNSYLYLQQQCYDCCNHPTQEKKKTRQGQGRSIRRPNTVKPSKDRNCYVVSHACCMRLSLRKQSRAQGPRPQGRGAGLGRAQKIVVPAAAKPVPRGSLLLLSRPRKLLHGPAAPLVVDGVVATPPAYQGHAALRLFRKNTKKTQRSNSCALQQYFGPADRKSVV